MAERAYRLEDGLPHQWRELEDADIEQILEALPKRSLRSSIDTRALKLKINAEIDELADAVLRARMSKKSRRRPHEELKDLRKLRGSLRRTMKCLAKCSFSLGDACRDLSKADLAFAPSTVDSWSQIVNGPKADLDFAPSTVDPRVQIDNGLRMLNLAIAANEAIVEQRQAAATSKMARKQHDYVRYEFIATLADIFERFFRMRTTQSRDGPWCTFLAQVLSRCEDRPITDDAAHALWKNLGRAPRLRGGAAHRECARYFVRGPRETLPSDWATRIDHEDAAAGGLLCGRSWFIARGVKGHG